MRFILNLILFLSLALQYKPCIFEILIFEIFLQYIKIYSAAVAEHKPKIVLFNGIQLGDANEPLLAEALALISGTQRRQAKGRSIETAPAFNMLPKSFNDIKSNRIIHVK